MHSALSDDELAVDRHVTAAQATGSEISHACARVIASWFATGDSTITTAFASTGAILADDPCELWRALVADTYRAQPPWLRRALDCLGTYLLHRSDHGPVPGWSQLWIR